MIKTARFLFAALFAACVVWESGAIPGAVSNGVVISQVYGGGGNAGATLKNDFIELFNRGSAPVSLNGMSVQYASAAGVAWQVTSLTNVTLQPGQYYLIQEAQGAGGTLDLPAPDASGTIPMSATAGRVALVSTTTALSGCTTVGAVDVIAYGAVMPSCSESSPAPGLSNTTASIRAQVGCTDTDNNSADFATGTPNPRNTASTLAPCGVTTNPSATGSATPGSVPPGNNVVLSAIVSGGLNPASTGLAVSCSMTAVDGTATPLALPLSSGNVYSTTYTVPAGAAAQAYTLPCTVTDAQSRSGSFSIALTVTAPPPPLVCDPSPRTSTAIHLIQGAGLSASAAFLNQVVEVEGVVVADLQLSSQLSGFYLQEPDALTDGNPATSEGIFVFDGGNGLNVSLGDKVRVKGRVAEFAGNGDFAGGTRSSSLTEIVSVENKQVCGTGTLSLVTPATVTLPTTTATEDLEAFEGMLVSIPTRLVVTGNFNLGTFGQIDLAPTVLIQPTHFTDRGSWPGRLDLIKRSVLTLDDASTRSNASLFPTLFPQGGLSASHTLRIGDIVNYDAGTQTNTPLVGILDDRFGAYRVHPTEPVSFFAANPRPAIAPIVSAVGGRFRAVSANVLNFFTTFGSRGAANQAEFDGQKTKIVEELIGMNPDVIGLSEVQNFANGNTSGGTYTNAALQSLVNGLNCRLAGFDPLCAGAPSGPFAFIDTVPNGAQNDTDAIRNAIAYRTDRLEAVGGPVLRSQVAPDFGNRPSLAQLFQPAAGVGPKPNIQKFTFVVNHFRSKGGAGCGAGDNDAAQGNCNGTRLRMAQNIDAWLAINPTGDPTATANRRFLLVGDFNAYLGEDPMQFFSNQNYVNLIDKVLGVSAYSYNFGSQRGYLDHAIVNGAMNSLVKSVAEWHNNSDEPSSLQALDTNIEPAAADYYDPDAFAASDHDPIVIGFNTLAGDLNDDGVVDAADQRMITSSYGRSASLGDRRMDYDGDGIISLNDYRTWVIHYRAYLQ